MWDYRFSFDWLPLNIQSSRINWNKDTSFICMRTKQRRKEKKRWIAQEEYYKKKEKETILYRLNRSLFPASFKLI